MTVELLNKIKPGQEVVDQIEYFDHVRAADVQAKTGGSSEASGNAIRGSQASPTRSTRR